MDWVVDSCVPTLPPFEYSLPCGLAGSIVFNVSSASILYIASPHDSMSEPTTNVTAAVEEMKSMFQQMMFTVQNQQTEIQHLRQRVEQLSQEIQEVCGPGLGATAPVDVP